LLLAKQAIKRVNHKDTEVFFVVKHYSCLLANKELKGFNDQGIKTLGLKGEAFSLCLRALVVNIVSCLLCKQGKENITGNK